MKKTIFIYNPKSGDRGISRRLDYLIGKFQSSNILLQPYRLYEDKPEKLLGILNDSNYDFVTISGGDGSINAVANIMLKNSINLPLGIIPSGTCNDFAKSLGIPQSADRCVDIILSGNTADVDVGLINEDQYFLSTCAGGIFVDVSFNTHNELKKNFGPFAYYLKALSEVANIRSFKLKIETDDETIEQTALMFLILNGKHGGGFSNLIKEADVSDGIMDIVLIRSCSHIDLASLFFKALSNESLQNKNVTILRSKSCTITGNEDVILSVDGEKGCGLPISVRFINKALKVFVPR